MFANHSDNCFGDSSEIYNNRKHVSGKIILTVRTYPIILMLLLVNCERNKEQAHVYFTGEIEYSYSYSSDNLNTDSLKLNKPWKSEFRYDLENYQSKFTGTDTFTYFYSGKLNRCLSMKNGIPDSLCEDYGIDTDSVISFKVYDTNEKVVGYECRIIEYQSKLFRTKYYVSKDLRIAPGTYEKHKSYNWSFYGRKAEGGLIMKIEHRFKNYTMYGTATSVTAFSDKQAAWQIDAKLFDKMCAGK